MEQRYASLAKDRLLNIQARVRQKSVAKILTFKNRVGSVDTNRDISGENFVLEVYTIPSLERTTGYIFQLTVGNGLTVQGADNHQLKIDVTAAQAKQRPDVYFWLLISQLEGLAWLNGDWEFISGKYDGVVETTEIIISENGEEVVIIIEDGGTSVDPDDFWKTSGTTELTDDVVIDGNNKSILFDNNESLDIETDFLNIYNAGGKVGISTVADDTEGQIVMNAGSDSEGGDLTLRLNGPASNIIDTRTTKKGLRYAASGYVTDPQSLSDKEYVDAKVEDEINDGTTTIAPSQNAVFDALNGKQDELVSGTNIKTINGSSVLGSGNLSIGGASYLLQSTQPASTSDIWVDTGNAYAGMYPVRRYIDGAWEPVNPNMDFYDPIGDILSRGRPLLAGVAGQSNTATAFNRPYLGSKDAAYYSTSSTSINTATSTVGASITITIGTGLSWKSGDHVNLTSLGTPSEFIIGKVTAYNSGSGSFTFTVIFAPVVASSYTDWIITVQFPGDYEKDSRITIWNADTNAWVVPDYLSQAPSGTGTANNWSWNLCPHGANNVQTFAKEFIKATGRAIRIVQWREGGTPMAYWEKNAASGGFPGWVALDAAMIAAGVPPIDVFLFIQGEGGLGDGTYVSQYSSYYESLYRGITNNVRTATWGKRETVFIMPSVANGMENYPVSENSDVAEFPIRSLSDGNNPYNAWAQGSHEKDIRVPTAGEGLFITSSTSVNPATVTNPFVVTIPLSLPVFSDPVWLVSRSDNNYRIKCTTVSYVAGTGALTLTPLIAYGVGAKTDWDVLPQDPLHLDVNDNVANGKAIYDAFSNITFRKKQRTAQTINPYSKVLISSITEHSSSDSTREIYSTKTLNAGYPVIFEFASGGATPATKIFAKSVGANSEVDLIFASETSAEATESDENFRVSYYGTKFIKPIYFRYIGATALDARIQKTSSGLSQFGIDIVGGTTGSEDSIVRILHGNNEAFRSYEGGGKGVENIFQKSLVSQDNTTEKTRRATENRVGLFSSALAASATLTSTVYQNDPITSIPAYSVIRIDLVVVGLLSDATKSFTAKKSALFRIETFGTVTMDAQDAATDVLESAAGIMPTPTTGIGFSVVSGQISATLTRGATVGDFKVSSITTATIMSL